MTLKSKQPDPQKPDLSLKPARISDEEFEVMELLANYVKTNNISALKELINSDGNYTLPGISGTIQATKTEFISFLEKKLNNHIEVEGKNISHSYSICCGCVYGKGVIKFTPSFFNQIFYLSSLSFRVDIKYKKIISMEICNNSIEESKFGFDSFSADFQKNEHEKSKNQKPSNFIYINKITLQHSILEANRFFNDDNYSVTLEKLEDFEKISDIPFSNKFSLAEIKDSISQNQSSKHSILEELSACLTFWKYDLQKQITKYLDHEIEKANKNKNDG